MVMTPSQMLPLGTPAPKFSLPDTRGREVSLYATKAKAHVVVFMCNHCPFVVHLREALAELGRACEQQGVAMYGINSNDVANYPADGPKQMAAEVAEQGYTFPYLFDETQEVAKAYQAACTPDFYVFDSDYKLAYRGQFDASRPGNGKPVTGADLRAAIEAVVAGRAGASEQTPSIGCNIKWKPGNAPDYFG
ncbi:MAG: thioredoxin family protein [Nannocystaceae bacterium]